MALKDSYTDTLTSYINRVSTIKQDLNDSYTDTLTSYINTNWNLVSCV